MATINPFQKSSGNPIGITTFGGAREQDVWNQFYPRTLSSKPTSPVVTPSPVPTPPATTPATTTPKYTEPTPEQIAARDAVRADLARRRKEYEASLPQPGPAPTKPPTQSDWWMNLLYNNPESFRNTIIGMSGRAQPYGGPAYGDTSMFGGGFSTAQAALDEYSRLYGRSPTDFTESELTSLATQGGLGGYAFGTAGMRGG